MFWTSPCGVAVHYSTGAVPQSRTTLPEGEQRKAPRGNYVVRDQSHGRKSVVRGLPQVDSPRL